MFAYLISKVHCTIKLPGEQVHGKKAASPDRNEEVSLERLFKALGVLNNDARIVAITSRDVVAAEGNYEPSCYRSYANINRRF